MLPTTLEPGYALKVVLLVCLVLFAACVGVVLGMILWAWVLAKREVKKAPREPMFICDIHGMFPSKNAIAIDVPGSETGKMDMCPFCLYDRVSRKKVPS